MTTEPGQQPVAYWPMTLVDLAGHLVAVDDDGHRRRLVAEFLEEYRHEPPADRPRLLADQPPSTGTSGGTPSSPRAVEGKPEGRQPPVRGPRAAVRVDAVVYAPASFQPRDLRHSGGELSVRMTAADEPLLDRARIQDLFCRLGERLQQRGVVADVYVIGGAAIALAYDPRRPTRDIDAVSLPHVTVLDEAQQWWRGEQASAYVAPGGDPEAPLSFDHPGLRVASRHRSTWR